MNILELSEFVCPGVGICHTSMEPGLRMVNALDLKLTLGMAEIERQ